MWAKRLGGRSDRLLEGDVAREFLSEVLNQAREKMLRRSAAHQVVKEGCAVRPEMDVFAVEDGITDGQGRRRPQPRRTPRMARSRSLLGVVAFGAFRSVCACRTHSQFPRRTPLDATPFTRVIPVANSGASSPLSATSTARFRTAVIR